jgi:flagellar hook-associated protein 2
LIDVAVAAKTQQATQISTKITSNQAKITAYQGLQTALGTLSKDLTSLSNSIINSLSGSIFAQRSATISATGDVSASAALSMSLKPGAATGTHTLTVSQIATAQKVAGASQSSQTDPLGYSGTFSLGLAGGATGNITVTSGMSLQDVADAINTQTSTTNVQASIVQVTGNSYQLVLTGTEDAADITYVSASGDDILNKLGVTNSGGAFTSVLQTSQPAKFTLDGISLSRNTNDIQDVLSGVTFSLLQATPAGTTLKVDVEPDTDQITTAIQTFVTDYNAVRDAVLAQQATNADGTAASSAVLFGDSTMRGVMDQLQSILSTSVGGMSLGDMGLEFNAKNELAFGNDKGVTALSDALKTNLSGVMKFLTAQTTTSSSQLSVINTSTAPQSFKLDVSVDASGKLLSASVNGDSSLFTISGNSIIGAGGTIYAGMAFNYTGSTSQSITVTSTSGIAAQISQLAGTSSASTGSLQTQIDSLTTQDTAMQSKVNDIQSAAITYRAQLEAQYATYQAQIQSSNTLLNYLKALLNAGSNNQ